ncbi:MAG TPA: type II and III secretion system protein, partial [Desulfobacteraceae bacterium]|nr:type II and III secretion system protein [Desulfobacteraceae bacterium]
MKLHKAQLAYTLCAILLIFLVSCAKKESTKAPAEKSVSGTSATSGTSAVAKKAELTQLPVRFRQTGYITQEEPSKDVLGQAGEYQIKVGANITSTKGPQPLWDILKRLANLKGMSVSWASDVDPNVRVDVDISADDNFFDAINNLLRQVDYFQVVKNNVIIVKYRESKRFQISIPYMTSEYTTN